MAISALFFCCGIILARCVYLPVGALYVSSIILLVLALVFLKNRIFILLIILIRVSRHRSIRAESAIPVWHAGRVGTHAPVRRVGVPVPLKYLDGMDSLLSIVQMPAGIPVATVGIGNAKNAGLLAARILATSDAAVSVKVAGLMEKARVESLEKARNLNASRGKRTGF